ncbi:hypothetical protein ADJ79_10385 [Ottowia sp. oral taxon 894]|nr:hypothetical protein ADJ79_10385 [Ottowia sp. oral taxon 894]
MQPAQNGISMPLNSLLFLMRPGQQGASRQEEARGKAARKPGAPRSPACRHLRPGGEQASGKTSARNAFFMNQTP